MANKKKQRKPRAKGPSKPKETPAAKVLAAKLAEKQAADAVIIDALLALMPAQRWLLLANGWDAWSCPTTRMDEGMEVVAFLRFLLNHPKTQAQLQE